MVNKKKRFTSYHTDGWILSAIPWVLLRVRSSARRVSRQALLHLWICCWSVGTATSSFWAGNTGGWYPREASKGETPVAELIRVLCAYLTQGNSRLLEEGFRAAMQWRAAPRSWLACSACPLDWGWYPDERLAVVPSARQEAFHTWEMNWGPLLGTVSAGIPWRRLTCCTIKSPWIAGKSLKTPRTSATPSWRWAGASPPPPGSSLGLVLAGPSLWWSPERGPTKHGTCTSQPWWTDGSPTTAGARCVHAYDVPGCPWRR